MLSAYDVASIVVGFPFSPFDIYLREKMHVNLESSIVNIALEAKPLVRKVASERYKYNPVSIRYWVGNDITDVCDKDKDIVLLYFADGIAFPCQLEWEVCPEFLIIEAQLAMHALSLQKAHVNVLIGDYGLKRFEIDYDIECARHILETTQTWYLKHVLLGEVPEITAPPKTDLKQLPRTRKQIELDVDEDVETYLRLQQEKKKIENELERIKAFLIIKMGDADEIVSKSFRVTYYEYQRQEVYLPSTTYRMFKVKRI